MTTKNLYAVVLRPVLERTSGEREPGGVGGAASGGAPEMGPTTTQNWRRPCAHAPDHGPWSHGQNGGDRSRHQAGRLHVRHHKSRPTPTLPTGITVNNNTGRWIATNFAADSGAELHHPCVSGRSMFEWVDDHAPACSLASSGSTSASRVLSRNRNLVCAARSTSATRRLARLARWPTQRVLQDEINASDFGSFRGQRG